MLNTARRVGPNSPNAAFHRCRIYAITGAAAVENRSGFKPRSKPARRSNRYESELAPAIEGALDRFGILGMTVGVLEVEPGPSGEIEAYSAGRSSRAEAPSSAVFWLQGRRDTLIEVEGDYRLRHRTVILDIAVLMGENLSTILWGSSRWRSSRRSNRVLTRRRSWT